MTSGMTARHPRDGVGEREKALPAPMPVAPRRDLPRRRRRTGLLGLGVALVAVGALLAGWLTVAVGGKVPVLAVARPVPYGTAIVAEDLAEAHVAPDPALDPIPAAQREAVVGRHAAVDLRPGALLTEGQLSDQPLPSPGYALVGVAVRAAQVPAQPLAAQDRVLVVSTPPAEAAAPALAPDTVEATVVRVGPTDDTGLTVVDLTVPEPQAGNLAARAATGRVALIVRSRSG